VPVTPSMSGLGGGDACPNCGEPMAADQRYCLNCGHRRGDPRLPFMDAVTFMESMSAPGGAGTPPPPPSPTSSGGSNNRWNANAALIAGVATLVLAIGVGFLIGRSGHENGSQAAAPPQVIKVEGNGGGGGESEAAATSPEEESESTAKSGSKGGSKKGKSSNKPAAKKKASEIEEGSKEEEERAKAKTDEALHTKEGIELETEVEVGGKCTKGTAGCSENGKFEGEFFE
jgi:hypothetical protein